MRYHRNTIAGTGGTPARTDAGHVTLQLDGAAAGRDATSGEDVWDRMTVALSSWKAEVLIDQALAHLRQGLTQHIDPQLVMELRRAEESIAAAVSSLHEVDRLLHTR